MTFSKTAKDRCFKASFVALAFFKKILTLVRISENNALYGCSVNDATKRLEGQSVAYKNELLFGYGINFDALPSWQKRGIGIWWDDAEKEGYNPITEKLMTTTRRELHTEIELPLREEYASFIAKLLEKTMSDK